MYVEHQLVKQATLIIEFVTIAICNTKITMVSVFTEHGTTSLNHPSCSNNTLSIAICRHNQLVLIIMLQSLVK